jgi:LysR family nitrogen assimilation transcriptional regulator
MDIKQLRYFLATVDHGNMTRAAEAVRIAQPALSQQIAGLEREIGSKILERSVRGVKPTAVGEVLYRHAKGLLRHMEDLKGAVSFQKEHPSGRVAIGVPGSTARILINPLLSALQRYPGILIEVTERPSSELTGLVAQGNLDLAIAIDALPQRGVAIEPLFFEELFVIMPPKMGGRKSSGITLEQLGQMPLILPTAPNTIRTRIDLAFLNANVNYQLVAEISATDLLIHVVRGGLACSVLPWSAIHDEVREGRLNAAPFKPTTIAREVSICTSEDMQLSETAEIVKQEAEDILNLLHKKGEWKGSEKVAPRRR